MLESCGATINCGQQLETTVIACFVRARSIALMETLEGWSFHVSTGIAACSTQTLQRICFLLLCDFVKSFSSRAREQDEQTRALGLGAPQLMHIKPDLTLRAGE